MPRMKNLLEKQRTLEEIIDDANSVETKETASADEAAVLDGGGEVGQSSDLTATEPTEGERELARRIAKRMGWAPKEEWKRDPAKWEDEFQFLERTPNELVATRQRNAELAERAKRASQAAEAALEEDRRRLRAEAEAQVRAAADAKDPDAAAAAARQLAASSGPSPRVSAWVAERPWYRDDPGARAVASTAADLAAKAGYNEVEQLEAADMAVKKRFPEYYADQVGSVETQREAPRTEEVRLSEIRRAPVVNSPSRTTPSTPPNKEKGYADIPATVRHQYEATLLKRFTNRGQTPEDAKARYAKAYWAELRE